MKKLLIVDPYLDVLGGGEAHVLSIGKVFEEKGYQVSLFWNDEKIVSQLSSRLNLDTSKFLIEKTMRKGKGYDTLIYVTDGSYFFPDAKNNYVFCMYPQKSLYNASITNKLKWRKWNFFSNSQYTAAYISQWTGKNSITIYPFIANDILKQYVELAQKKKIILSVGRFFNHLHAKNQHLLIEAFCDLQNKNETFKDFSLVLLGGVKAEDETFFEKVQSSAKANPSIKIIKNASYAEVLHYYHDAFYYWHAAGLDVDLTEHPERTEHLGMSVLEAMATGCITFSHNSGGPKEIIKTGKTGYLYNSLQELVEMTEKSMLDYDTLNKINSQAHKEVRDNFNLDVFRQKVCEYFEL